MLYVPKIKTLSNTRKISNNPFNKVGFIFKSTLNVNEVLECNKVY